MGAPTSTVAQPNTTTIKQRKKICPNRIRTILEIPNLLVIRAVYETKTRTPIQWRVPRPPISWLGALAKYLFYLRSVAPLCARNNKKIHKHQNPLD